MAKFNSTMMPPRPEPWLVREMVVGQTRFVSEHDLDAMADGTALISLLADVRKQRSFTYPVAVTRTGVGWRVEVPRGFKVSSTRAHRPLDHDEVHEVVVGERKPDAGPGDYGEGIAALIGVLFR